MRCKSNESNTRWLTSIEELESQLLDNDTPTDTVNVIVSQLHRWRGNIHEVPIRTSSTFSAAILYQSLIRWQAFLDGCLALEWREHASTFFTSNKAHGE